MQELYEELEWKEEEQKKLHKKHEQIAEDVVIFGKTSFSKICNEKCCRKYSYLRYDTALYFGNHRIDSINLSRSAPGTVTGVF